MSFIFLIGTTGTGTHLLPKGLTVNSKLLQRPLRLRTPGFDKCHLFLLLLAQHTLYEAFAEPFREAQLEDHVVQRLLHRAVRRLEERVVAAAAVVGVGVEARRAVVLGHHAPLLARAVAVRHQVGILHESAGIDVDFAILGIRCLGLDVDVVDKNFDVLHCF